MRDMHALATEQDDRGDANALAGELPALAAVGVSAAAIDVRAVRAGKPRGPSGTGEVARIIRTAWLVIATGGWWTVSDVREARPSLRGKKVADRIWEMRQQGLIVVREIPEEKRRRRAGRGPRERLEYSVTPECKVPFGLTAGEVCRAFYG